MKATIPVGQMLYEFKEKLGDNTEPEVLTLTERNGFVAQSTKFKKRLAVTDTKSYKVIRRGDIAFNPYLLWAGAVAHNTDWETGLISPLYPTFRVREGYDSTFVSRLLLTGNMIERYDTIAFGSIPRKRRSSVQDFLALEIPEPPSLRQQRRIAAILDSVDELRAQRRQFIAHLDALTQSIFRSMFGDPATNSAHLPLVSLGSIGRWQSGGTPLRSVDSFFEGDIPWYTSGELDRKYLAQTKEMITEDAVSQSSAKFFPAGALLLGMYDTAALKSGISTTRGTCNQAIAFGLLDPNLAQNDYVYECIQIAKDHYRRLRRGVRQKNLNLSMIRDIEIPLPPLERQQGFSTRMAAVEQMREVGLAQLAKLDSLFASLQSAAFTGTLSQRDDDYS
ncbi:restriction endonuclease subunit S [Pseudarthrobacter sp. S6]|uniref:restriction endonuclease subunit S n=1 Tax=Pseudarthrobacter sp. S6 TaxID=3418420 RepID=UPI003CF83A8A